MYRFPSIIRCAVFIVLLMVVIVSCTHPSGISSGTPQSQHHGQNFTDYLTKEPTKMTQNKTLLVYQTNNGLYLAGPNYKGATQLADSDSTSRFLTASPDGQLICYTFQTNKVHILNLVSNKLETFTYSPDPRASYDPRFGSAPYAAFVDKGKGLVFLPAGFFRSAPSRIPQGYIERRVAQQPNLFYYEVGSDSVLQAVGDMSLLAEPRFSDDQLYYVPMAVGSPSYSIISYDLHSSIGRVIVMSNERIADLALGGNVQSVDGAALFYVTAVYHASDSGDNLVSNKVYSQMPLDANQSSLLIDDSPVNSQNRMLIRITTSSTNPRGFIVLAGRANPLFMLDPKQKQAVSLDVDKRHGTLYGAYEALLNPDGTRLAVTGITPDGNDRWYAILGADYQTLVPPTNFSMAGGFFNGWLNDSVHYYYYNQDNIKILDTATGSITVIANQGRSHETIDVFRPVGILPSTKSVLYLKNRSLYSVHLDEQSSTELLNNIEDAWLVSPEL